MARKKRASERFDPVMETSRALLAWRAESDSDRTDLLIGWLQGYGLPPVGPIESPADWLLQAIPLGRERYAVSQTLAAQIAAILSRQPDTQPIGDCPEQVLYGLLTLAAGLACADQLAEPLHELLLRRKLRGEYRGVNLRAALCRALIVNQCDNRLYDDWKALLKDRKHDFLVGSEYDGFDGMYHKPQSAQTRGKPDLDAIGFAGAHLADHLSENARRRAILKEKLDRVMRFYPDQDWELGLLLAADREHWPKWAVECLPSLRGG